MSSLAWMPQQTNKAACAQLLSMRHHTKCTLEMKRDRINNLKHLLEFSRFKSGGDLEVGGGLTAVQKKGGGAAWTLHSIIYIYASHRILLQRFLLVKPAEGFRQISAMQ